MRRPQVQKLGERIVVGSYVIGRHFPICENREEVIEDVVGECPAIARIGPRAPVVKAHDIRQQCPRYAQCLLWGVPTGVLQRVRKDGDEMGVVRRLCGKVSIPLLAGKKDRLRGQRTAVSLHPTAARAVQRPHPKVDFFRPEDRVWHFQDNAAHVFVGEEILPGELEAIQGTDRAEEERIAPPANEKAVIASFRYPYLPVQRDRRRVECPLSAEQANVRKHSVKPILRDAATV
jgi:hypothetical protein